MFKKQAYAEKNQLIEDAQNFGEDLRSLIEKVRTINVEKIELQGRLNLVSDLVDTNVKNQQQHKYGIQRLEWELAQVQAQWKMEHPD